MTKEIKPNRLGWVTGITFEAKDRFLDVTSYGDSINRYIANPAIYTARIDVVATDPGALMEQFREWMHSGISSPVYQKEFMCLYCGSPNKIERTHCSKCGAPRSFVIG